MVLYQVLKITGQQDDLAGEVLAAKTWGPEFNSWDLHGGSRDSTPINFPLTSICVHVQAGTHTDTHGHTHTHIQILKKYKTESEAATYIQSR